MRAYLKRLSFRILSGRTMRALRFDFWRLSARLRHHRRTNIVPSSERLHLGCGSRKIQGWLNVDVTGSEFDLDLAAGQLPFADHVFSTIVSQHVIEHLELSSELQPLLRELHRTCKSGAKVWLSCPDLEKICAVYAEDQGKALVADRADRFPGFDLNGVPPQQVINLIFIQDGEHRNLLDLEILTVILEEAGFTEIQRQCEKDLLEAIPEFSVRGDDLHSIYVSAVA